MSRPSYTASDKRDLASFEALCNRVDKIDSGAAKYLRRLARGWNPVRLRSCGVQPFTPDADISRCFQWDQTGAGFSMRRWWTIFNRLEAQP